jgi:ABC-type lipoprotein export system ATPase subunit
VEELERLLQTNNIPLPEPPTNTRRVKGTQLAIATKHGLGIMRDGNVEELKRLMDNVHKFHRSFPVAITFKDLSYWTMAAETQISTVGNSLYRLFCGSGPKRRIDILKGLTGRFLPNKMTLILGPPGCGKSVFMQALSNRLKAGNAKLDGEICYNGENIKTTNKFLVGKIVDYVEQNDTHAATLTVEETIKYAWLSSTGGHHAYGVAKDQTAAAVLDDLDAMYSKVNNLLIIMGLTGCKNTVVGDQALKGISGGQKRRVTSAEMLATPRQVRSAEVYHVSSLC